MINKFLSRKYQSDSTVLTVPKKTIFLSNFYFGHKSVQLNIQIRELVSQYFPHIDLRTVLVNPLKIGSLFPFKDSLPMTLRSRVIYRYSCEQSVCSSVYYGSTIRTLSQRIAEHRGVSPRTGNPVVRPPESSIRDHVIECNSNLSAQNFKIVASNNSTISLRILESLYIINNKPDLNNTKSAFPLKIVTY